MPIYRFEDLKDVREPRPLLGPRESIKGERMYFCHRIWEAGTEAKPHYHACEQFIYIMRGRQKFTMGGEVHELGPGDVIPHTGERGPRGGDDRRGRGHLRQGHYLEPERRGRGRSCTRCPAAG